MSHSKFTDSAGVPWDGRSFEQNRFANDDGTTPEKIQNALDSHSQRDNLELIVESLAEQRLLIPLLATLGESEIGSHGQTVDKSADLAIVAVATPDGKTAIPVFTSVAEMSAWKKDARPVPVEAERVAIAAIAEGHDRVILNPASAAIALRRPALAALAQGISWVSPENSTQVRSIVESAVAASKAVESFELIAGDQSGSLLGPELKILLRVKAGMTAEQLQEELSLIASELGSEEFLNLVDSVAFQVLAS